jgi:hypothetical protein
MDDEAIHSVVKRLSRQHPSGGYVIERAAIVAEGADSQEILEWIASHDGRPEAQVSSAPSGGLHRERMEAGRATSSAGPRRYVLPPGAVN